MTLFEMGLVLFTLALFITIIVLQGRMIAELEKELSDTFTLVDNTLKRLEVKQELEDNDLAQWAEHNGYTERQKHG